MKKRTALANVLFASLQDLVDAFDRGIRDVNADRNKMGFIFDHDDLKRIVA